MCTNLVWRRKKLIVGRYDNFNIGAIHFIVHNVDNVMYTMLLTIVGHRPKKNRVRYIFLIGSG